MKDKLTGLYLTFCLMGLPVSFYMIGEVTFQQAAGITILGLSTPGLVYWAMRIRELNKT